MSDPVFELAKPRSTSAKAWPDRFDIVLDTFVDEECHIIERERERYVKVKSDKDSLNMLQITATNPSLET